jgi:hypothetical protein
MSSVGVLLLGVGVYMMYVAYEAIHNGNKTSAAPLTKATASIS